MARRHHPGVAAVRRIDGVVERCEQVQWHSAVERVTSVRSAQLGENLAQSTDGRMLGLLNGPLSQKLIRARQRLSCEVDLKFEN